MTLATRDDIDRAVKLMIETGTSKSVGMVDPPEDTTLPYAVLLPLTVGPGRGGFNDAEEEHDYVYMVTCVGKDHRQAGAMSSSVHAAFTAKVGGNYVHAITILGNSVMWRLSDSKGAIVRRGTTLWQCQDQYRIRVGP